MHPGQEINRKEEVRLDVYAKAREELAKAKGDLEKLDTISYKAGIRHKKFAKIPHFIVTFLDQEYVIRLDTFEVILPDGSEAELEEKILVMHYVLGAETVPLAGELIAFKETPEGRFYEAKFNERVLQPLAEVFGRDPQRLLRIKDRFEAWEADFGDAALRITAFPFVPLTVVVWGADDDFPPHVQMLYDRTITSYLCSEDIIVFSELAARRLLEAVKEEGQ